MAGIASQSAARGILPAAARRRAARIALLVLSGLAGGLAAAQSLYKYQDGNGEWIYSDRPPDDGSEAEVRALRTGAARGAVTVAVTESGPGLRFDASNLFHAPVELRLRFKRLQGLASPERNDLAWVLPPTSVTTILNLDRDGGGQANAEYQYEYLVGDPAASHRPPSPYRVPFAIASNFPVTQAYPDAVTHGTPDARHAIDIAMPIGTDIFAARDGVVFDVSSDNFKSGVNRDRDGPLANVVQIMHDDGTYALYAHLNWNSIRVRPGDRVARGQYIADSGNTGFSSGPHLHFAVLRNGGMRIESVPVRFEGANSAAITPVSGAVLTAY